MQLVKSKWIIFCQKPFGFILCTDGYVLLLSVFASLRQCLLSKPRISGTHQSQDGIGFEQSTCLNLSSARITGLYHHTSRQQVLFQLVFIISSAFLLPIISVQMLEGSLVAHMLQDLFFLFWCELSVQGIFLSVSFSACLSLSVALLSSPPPSHKWEFLQGSAATLISGL